ncbi:uncharacterized protein LOC129409376 isoform X3 [Boleophthalmus pectinirostris]|uniref:uncharacterized protein LOC129409376 isoform X3 n=1 Tax=Boleophthalmus pectinirostris TaxID=150288 RepID=UPI00242F7F08|nr:uncharacterized protein LOC129409376 isoform X3 [Boleophthalmus pectinirostris]
MGSFPTQGVHCPKQRGHCANPPKIQRRKGRKIRSEPVLIRWTHAAHTSPTEARSRLLLRASGSRGTAIISTIIRTTRGRPRPHPHLSTHTPAPTPNRTGRAGGTEAGRLGSPQDRASRRLFHETVRSAGMLLQRGDHYSPMWTINRLNISHALQRSDTSPTALSNHMAFDYQLIKEDPIRAQPIQYLMYSV